MEAKFLDIGGSKTLRLAARERGGRDRGRAAAARGDKAWRY